MLGPARLASALASLAFTSLMMAGLIYLGGGMRKQAPAPAVSSFAISLGSEQGEEAPQQVPPAKMLPQQPREAKPTVQAAAELPPSPLVPLPVALPNAPAAGAASDIAPAPQRAAQTAEAALSAAASEPASVTRELPRKGARDGLDRVSDGNSRSYAAKVRSWLYANRIYPKRARMRHEEGVVRVRFVLDRQGNLLEGRLIAGSGVAALDQEGLAVLSRASPFPAAPREIQGYRIEFTVPIEFVLPL